jgi:hypothetical protein
MVLVTRKHKIDLSRPAGFLARHKRAMALFGVAVVLVISASMCLVQSGGLGAYAVGGTSSSSGHASTGDLAGGRCPIPATPIPHHQAYNFSCFTQCEWFLVLQFTDIATDWTPEEIAVANNFIDNFYLTKAGFVRWPRYKPLWSRADIGQPI